MYHQCSYLSLYETRSYILHKYVYPNSITCQWRMFSPSQLSFVLRITTNSKRHTGIPFVTNYHGSVFQLATWLTWDVLALFRARQCANFVDVKRASRQRYNCSKRAAVKAREKRTTSGPHHPSGCPSNRGAGPSSMIEESCQRIHTFRGHAKEPWQLLGGQNEHPDYVTGVSELE